MSIATFDCAVVVTLYWAIVIVKAGRLSRKIGKDPNVIPRERVGRWMRVLWAPTVIFWCVQPWLAGFGVAENSPVFERIWGAQDTWGAAVAVVGALGAVIALAFTMVCWRQMGSSWRIGIDPGERTALIQQGPYRFVRHPIYALSMLLMLAVVLVLPTPAMLVTAAIHMTMLQVEARREERFLLRTHAVEYAQYCRSVGRFVPRWRGSQPRGCT